MPKHRFEQVIAVAAVSLAAGVPQAHAQQPTLDVAAHLHARAVVDTTKAERVAERSATTARRLVVNATRRLERSARIVVRAGAQTSETVTQDIAEAQIALSASAAKQGDALARIADDANGRLKATTVRALARVAAVEASVSANVAANAENAESGTAEAGDRVAADLASMQAAVSATGGKALRSVAKRLADARNQLLETLRSLRSTSTVEVEAEVEVDVEADADGDADADADVDGQLDALIGGGGR